MYDFLISYKKIISKTQKNNMDIISEIDQVMDDIRNHIKKLDIILYERRNHLMLAMRLVECFRILEWIKVCLFCGAYHSVYRELRYLIDSIAQAYFIDTKMISANLDIKFNVFEMLDKDSSFIFIGQKLISKLDGMPEQSKINSIYSELSNFVHPSYDQAQKFMEKASEKESYDRMKENIYDEINLRECVNKCKEVINCFLKINKKFEKIYLNEIKKT